MTPEASLALLVRLQHAFASLAATTPPSAEVPGLGGWPARELVLHLAGIHHWAAGMAVGDESRDDELSAPAGLSSAGLADLYAGRAGALATTLREAGPDGAAVTLVGPGPARFWFRRQLHETLVHLGDLVAARTGTWSVDVLDDVVPVTPEVWADGVDEVVTMFEPRQVRLGRIAQLARTVELRASDTGGSWVLGGFEDSRPATDEPAVVVTGEARALDLVLWRRVTPEAAGVVVDGDPSALTDALATAITP